MLESIITATIAIAVAAAMLLILRSRRRESCALAKHRAEHAAELRQHLGEKPERHVANEPTPRFEGGSSAGQRIGGGQRTWGSQGFSR